MAVDPLRNTMPLRRRADTRDRLDSDVELPSDLVRASSRRLVSFVLISAATFALFDVLYRTVWAEQAIPMARTLSLLVIGDSLFIAWYLTRRPRSVRTIVVFGVLYEVLVCLTIAVMEYWEGDLPTRPLTLISWTCVVILFFPMLVPCTARRTLLGSLLAASMNPIAFLLVVPGRGLESPSPEILLSMFLPPYLSAVIAFVAARVVNQMGQAVRVARELGSYQLLERLGEGGMGEVWRARHRMLIRPAAVKLIRPDALGATDPDAAARLRRRFELEAQATAALESPHTVQLFDFGVTDDGTFYYAMELLQGIDLETLVERFGPIAPERIVYLLLQVCDSLEDAHRRGLVHRDIKPANIFLSRRGRRYDYVRVLDFGLVKAQAGWGAAGPKATAIGELHGTPAYLAPEMVKDDVVDGRADLYAVGCVAFWLLTGRLVFDDASPMKLAIAHASRPPEPPSHFTELPVPPDLEALILECLKKEPAERPADADELARRLAACDVGEVWDAERAAKWWRTHLPEQVGEAPLSLELRAV